MVEVVGYGVGGGELGLASARWRVYPYSKTLIPILLAPRSCTSGSHHPLSTLSNVGKQRAFQVAHTSSHNHSTGSVLDELALFG